MAEVESAPATTIIAATTSEGITTVSERVVTISNELVATENTLVAPTNEASKKVKRIVRKKRRPARVQVDPADVKSEPPQQTGTTFNIWYNKWSGGDREDAYLAQTHAKGRCNVAQDSGYTKADLVQGSFFCLMFARGICMKGHECQYLHRLPGIHDHFNPNVDCFGRDKHSDYRDDMGGVGSFMKQNRTIYVGRIHVTDDIEEIVARHFAEWGEVDRTRVLTGRGIAFVTYASETGAQFAKEAMAHQSLENDEVLNVRWATQDPNPLAHKREAKRIEEQAVEAIRRALPAEFVAEIEGRDPETIKRRRLEEKSHTPYALEKGPKQKAIEANTSNSHIEVLEEVPTKTSEEPALASLNQPIGGILSNSTIAALKNYSLQAATSTNTSPILGGALVGYDSENDSG